MTRKHEIIGAVGSALPHKAFRLLPLALTAFLLPALAHAQGTGEPPLIRSAEYTFPFYEDGGGNCFNSGGGPCQNDEVTLEANRSGTKITKWAFTAFSHNASCKKHRMWQGASSSSPAAADEDLLVGGAGLIHYVSPHPTKSQRLEVSATVIAHDKTIKGWFLINSRVEGRQCSTGRARFTASTND